jgi:hypothetical protein
MEEGGMRHGQSFSLPVASNCSLSVAGSERAEKRRPQLPMPEGGT